MVSTYLTTVVQNLYRDFRIARWGKWRPTARTRRRGVLAIQLESLLSRDGLELAEALQVLRDRFRVRESDEELEQLAASLTTSPRPRAVGAAAGRAAVRCQTPG